VILKLDDRLNKLEYIIKTVNVILPWALVSVVAVGLYVNYQEQHAKDNYKGTNTIEEKID